MKIERNKKGKITRIKASEGSVLLWPGCYLRSDVGNEDGVTDVEFGSSGHIRKVCFWDEGCTKDISYAVEDVNELVDNMIEYKRKDFKKIATPAHFL